VISLAELRALSAEWQLRLDVVEKDYALGWLLAAIAEDPDLSRTWVFKGGTCLRKCYYETYRFSEDLDFTVVDGGPEEPEQLVAIFRRIGVWLQDQAGLETQVDDQSFRRRQNLRGNPTTEGRVAFRGPTMPPTLPKIKLDLTSDEVLGQRPVRRAIVHSYSDQPLPTRGVLAYTAADLAAEKIRALAERCRPRDLYDVVHIHRHPDLIGEVARVRTGLRRKCEHAGMAVPESTTIQDSPFREEIEQEWGNMLAHQLPFLPPFDEFWGELDSVFGWLHGPGRPAALARAEVGDLDSVWVAPTALVSWRRGVPLELLRFSGANRLKVEIDYRAERGRQGPRVVDPYALRRSRDGNLLLMVVNDRGLVRSYRVDRVAGIRVTNQSFRPRYRVEF
jgi:predicted nucleotidyltransferase component of viral defense system